MTNLEQPNDIEWPPGFVLTWNGLFNLCIGDIQFGDAEVAKKVFARVAHYLEQRGIKMADVDLLGTSQK